MNWLMLTFVILSAAGPSPAYQQPDVRQVTEITQAYTQHECEGCPDYRVLFRRDGTAELRQQRPDRTWEAYVASDCRKLFIRLLDRLMAAGYFRLKDEYEMGWEGGTCVRNSVGRVGQRKWLKTEHMGEVPSNVRLIFGLIDEAVKQVRWQKVP